MHVGACRTGGVTMRRWLLAACVIVMGFGNPAIAQAQQAKAALKDATRGLHCRLSRERHDRSEPDPISARQRRDRGGDAARHRAYRGRYRDRHGLPAAVEVRRGRATLRGSSAFRDQLGASRPRVRSLDRRCSSLSIWRRCGPCRSRLRVGGRGGRTATDAETGARLGCLRCAARSGSRRA